MPRPLKLRALRRELPKPFALTAEQRTRILETIETGHPTQVLAEVESILSTHQWREYRDKERPGSVVATLKASLTQLRRRGTTAASASIGKLEPGLRLEIGLADDQLSDAVAVERALVQIIERYEKRIQANAPTDGARRATFECLATVFDQFSTAKIPARKLNPKRREFVVAACDCAEIKCPDPTVGQTHFNKLLPPV